MIVQDGERWIAFEAPLAVLEARDAGSVLSLLREADSALAAGRFVAGYLAYEAAAAFGLATRPPDPDGPPLAWLGVFEAPREVRVPAAARGAAARRELRARARRGWSRRAARAGAGADRRGRHLPGEPDLPDARDRSPRSRARFSRGSCAAQRPRHAAFLDLGRFAIASASPELFFRRDARGRSSRGR